MERLSKYLSKPLSFIWENILFYETIFLLIFIPLFPKIPVLDVRNTWVYIRAEDFIVFFVLISWIILLLKKKISLKTPLTLPILTFWIIGGLATIHGVLVIFPTIANVFPNVAFLSLLRHIEYMSLFFIAYHGIKDKRQIKLVIATLVLVLLGVVAYGFGQKYLGFPAYLTMNEEFAKGIPIKLSELSRVPSTFAGHYDLAAYLVLIIPILASLFFGVRNWLIKIFLLASSLLGLALLFMTVSRVSFFVLFIALFIVVWFQKRKLLLLLIPMGIAGVLFLLTFQSSLFDRFKSTVSEAEVLVDAKTGESVGHVKFVNKDYFADKIVLQRRVSGKEEMAKALRGVDDETAYSSASAILPFRLIPEEVALVNAVNMSTGENLPQGTGYINLYLSPVTKRVGNFFYELPSDSEIGGEGSPSAQILVLHGDFIIKRASAYDLSFTTRFQGEWPRALTAFMRNVALGSGYGSVSLAVDNNYLRILGEVGLLGFLALLIIFISFGIYVRKIYPDIDSPIAKSFVLGFSAGFIGLALNATLIDVFEASKIAFLLWILVGITLKLLTLYQKHSFSLINELKKTATSTYAVVIYLLVITVFVYSPMLGNYFVGDDFTWLRWASDCSGNCNLLSNTIRYFTEANGFFYRPGTKLYFYLMHEFFWLNQVVYHLVSLLLHFTVGALFFVLAKRVFKDKLLAVASVLLFLVMSGYQEAVFWISSTGYLFNVVFGLLGLLSFIKWEDKRIKYYLGLSILFIALSLTFHELGIVYPLLIVAYKLKDGITPEFKKIYKRSDYLLIFTPVIGYLLIRLYAKSHWLSGDYSYDLLKLPFNLIGNALGYLMISITGPISLPVYSSLRNVARENILVSLILIPLLLLIAFAIYKLVNNQFENNEKRALFYGALFFFISLIPFIGLGNITSRYSYLATLGVVMVVVILAKKIYQQMQIYGRDISAAVLGVVIILFSLFHVIGIHQTYSDWHGAGEKARRFFISLDSSFENSWSNQDVQFHFVNVPLRVGEAWVFPVGLEDAVWFAFKNEKARIFKHSDTGSAIQEAGLSRKNYVFEFTEDGSVVLVDRPLEPINPLN